MWDIYIPVEILNEVEGLDARTAERLGLKVYEATVEELTQAASTMPRYRNVTGCVSVSLPMNPRPGGGRGANYPPGHAKAVRVSRWISGCRFVVIRCVRDSAQRNVRPDCPLLGAFLA